MNLRQIIAQQSVLQHRVVAFTVENIYPLLFFSYLLKRQQIQSGSIVYLDMSGTTDQEIKAQLETSFLGMEKTYWLGAIHQLSKKKMQDWLVYLHEYTGPNSVLFACSALQLKPFKQIKASIMTVNIPEHIDKKQFKELFAYLVRDLKALDKRYIDQLYVRTDKITLDTAIVLMHYLEVMGAKSQEFFSSWLDQLVIPDKSLFKLSQYFFAKQRSTFFKAWSEIKEEYPEQFWISFWSEQIWRALFYCQMIAKRDVISAKKVGYRLPFSFLQKDYRLQDISTLQNAHQWLYDLDISLKNGGDAIGLDIFFSRFFESMK